MKGCDASRRGLKDHEVAALANRLRADLRRLLNRTPGSPLISQEALRGQIVGSVRESLRGMRLLMDEGCEDNTGKVSQGEVS